MKSKLVIVALMTVFLLPLARVHGQACEVFFSGTSYLGTDTLTCDTLRVVCPVLQNPIVAGDSVAIPILLWTDEPVGGFSLGFSYNSDFVEITSIRADLPANFSRTFIHSFKPADNQVLAGMLAFGPAGRIPATVGNQAQPFLTLFMKVLPGAPISSIDLDTVFVPPAGVFTLTVISLDGAEQSSGIRTRFIDCGTGDVKLPVFEYDNPILPQNYSLDQNQPNPFNPTTTISFALPRAAKTTIEIYNILGQKVTTLVDEYLAAGNKRVEWNGKDDRGNDVASGVYLYRMTANDFTETKKMMMMK